jgi:hypothetical protein
MLGPDVIATKNRANQPWAGSSCAKSPRNRPLADHPARQNEPPNESLSLWEVKMNDGNLGRI